VLAGSAGSVRAVCLSARHSFSKQLQESIRLIEGFGVDGDVHAGATVRHRYHMRKDPGAPNLSQVHLLHAELFAELQEQGIDVGAGQMGENITTFGVDLLALPQGTLLTLGEEAVVEITGLREPCVLMNALHPGLMKACLGKDDQGRKVRKAGVMSVVRRGGLVRSGDAIRIELPPVPHRALEAL
jgi:MOSC domain-containing protein YiiM